MFTLDIPDIPQHYPAVMVAQANQGLLASAAKERAMGYCEPVAYKSSAQHDVAHGLGPSVVAAGYFHLYEKRQVDPETVSRVEVLVPPMHGMLVPLNDYPLELDYIPDVGYLGNDKVVLRVHIGGTTVRIVNLLKVTDVGGEDSAEVTRELCKKTGIRWKISTTNALVPDNLQSVLTALGLSTPVQPV